MVLAELGGLHIIKKLLKYFALICFPGVACAGIGTGPGGSFINNQNVLQPSATFYVSSGTVKGLNVSTITFSDGSKLTTASSLGGGTTTQLQVKVNGVQVSSPTTSLQFDQNFTGSSPSNGIATISLSAGSTMYIQNRNTLQSGATFYVSSGTVNGSLFAVNYPLKVSLTPYPTELFTLINASSYTTYMIFKSSGTKWWYIGNDVTGLGKPEYDIYDTTTGIKDIAISTNDVITVNAGVVLPALTASEPVHTNSSNQLITGLISLTGDVSGTLPAGNLPSDVVFYNVPTTISASDVFTASETFNGGIAASSGTFVSTVTAGYFVGNGGGLTNISASLGPNDFSYAQMFSTGTQVGSIDVASATVAGPFNIFNSAASQGTSFSFNANGSPLIFLNGNNSGGSNYGIKSEFTGASFFDMEWPLGSNQFYIAYSSNSSSPELNRFTIGRANGKIDFYNPFDATNTTKLVEFDPVNNSSFTIPIYASSGTITTMNVGTLRFGDGTIQVTSAPVASGSGSNIYGATSTASFPFGFSASTGVFSGMVTAQSLTTSGAINSGSGSSISSLSSGILSNQGNNLHSLQEDYQGISATSPEYTTYDFSYTPSSVLFGAASFGLKTSSNTVQPGKSWAIIQMGDRGSTNTTDYFHMDVSTTGTTQGYVGLGNMNIYPQAPLVVGGHIEVSSTTPTLTSCGSGSPSVVGNDQWGTITVGGGVIGTCTLNFAKAWVHAPSCNVLSGTAIASLAGTSTTTTFTFTGTSISGDVVMYQCGGWE